MAVCHIWDLGDRGCSTLPHPGYRQHPLPLPPSSPPHNTPPNGVLGLQPGLLGADLTRSGLGLGSEP